MRIRKSFSANEDHYNEKHRNNLKIFPHEKKYIHECYYKSKRKILKKSKVSTCFFTIKTAIYKRIH